MVAPKASRPTAEQKREESRRAIQEAALQLFYTKGYEATTTRDIVKAAGILNGSLYNRFRSKDDILMSIITDVLDDFLSETERVLRDEKDPIAALAIPAATELYLASRSPRLADLIYQAHKSWEAVESYVDLYKGWLTKLWEEQHHSHIDSAAFATGLVAIIGSIGNICGLYAKGQAPDYRDVLSALLRGSSAALNVPLFETNKVVDLVTGIVESGDIRIMGHRMAELDAALQGSEQ